MIFTRYIIALFSCLILLSCGKTSSIIGRWKQLETEANDSIVGYKYERILTISADSVFTLDEGADNDSASGIPGWHAGGKINGTWRMPDKKRLELRIKPDVPLMVLNYEIIKLTGKELELIFPGWKTNPDAKPLRYIRL
jgi:hypothetical protein